MMDYKELSRNAFDIQAKSYDIDKNGRHARNLYQSVIEELSCLSFQSILDVGCGTGEILKMMKTMDPERSLYGIDLSEEMLKQAKGKLADQAELYLGDAEHLPFENEKFDLLICTDSFHHYPNPQHALQEFHRVLKNAGYLIMADYWKPFPIRQIMNLFLPFSKEGDVKIYSQNEIRNFLKDIGFQNLKYKKLNNSSYLATAKKTSEGLG